MKCIKKLSKLINSMNWIADLNKKKGKYHQVVSLSAFRLYWEWAFKCLIGHMYSVTHAKQAYKIVAPAS